MRVSSASGRAFGTTASVEVLRALDLTVAFFGAEDLDEDDEADLDNTDAVRDHFLSLYREHRIRGARWLYYACRVKGFNIPVTRRRHVFRLPSFQVPSRFRNPVEDSLDFMPERKTQAGG